LIAIQMMKAARFYPAIAAAFTPVGTPPQPWQRHPVRVLDNFQSTVCRRSHFLPTSSTNRHRITYLFRPVV